MRRMPPFPPRPARPLAFSVAAALLAAACAPAPGPAPIGEAALGEALSGATYDCREGDASWRASFARDGGYAYVHQGETHVGRWRLAGGPVLCTLDDGWPAEQCFRVARVGAGLAATREDGGVFTCAPV